MIALQIVGRFPIPDRQDLINRLNHLLVLVEIEIPEDLDIRGQAARANPHDHAPVEQMIEHGHLCSHMDRMIAGHIDHAGAQLDLAGLVDQRGQENHATRDRLCQIRHVLADECLTIAKFVGQDHRILILLQDLAIVAGDRMDGLGKKSELHS